MSALPRPPGSPSLTASCRALRVRGMRVDDLDAVMAIESAIYPFPWTRGNFADALRAGYDAWVFETATGPTEVPEGPGEAATQSCDASEGARCSPLGYAVVMWIPDEAHLLNLGVRGAIHGRGVGRAMLEWLMRDVRGRGGRGLMLEVRPSNLPAIALYRSAGFARIGVRRRYYPAPQGAREDAWVMFRELADE
ncbi:MAG: ribosomal protein S18-alanine N-acetyltransferase [Burkholderiaceae bacterium]|nr:ribosomal protein S18-alanine N-acetyltransferase [Burkholderiaceae bacterium]MEB2351441.1 ribosomal protein S18-alanine N-acetyltransferase [Burkholderiaceae bacterium]